MSETESNRAEVVGRADPGGAPIVRGHVDIEVALVVAVRACPFCGLAHRMALPDAQFTTEHVRFWMHACPRTPGGVFLVRVMPNTTRAAAGEAARVAAQHGLALAWRAGHDLA